MALRPGKKARNTSGRAAILSTVGRAVGFLAMAGPAMTIFAALILLPAHARLVHTRHALAVKKVEIRRANALRTANNRLIRTVPQDYTLARRLVLRAASFPLIRLEPPHHPPAPSSWLLTLAGRIDSPPARRGLFVSACLGLTAAMFLFGPPIRRASRSRRD